MESIANVGQIADDKKSVGILTKALMRAHVATKMQFVLWRTCQRKNDPIGVKVSAWVLTKEVAMSVGSRTAAAITAGLLCFFTRARTSTAQLDMGHYVVSDDGNNVGAIIRNAKRGSGSNSMAQSRAELLPGTIIYGEEWRVPADVLDRNRTIEIRPEAEPAEVRSSDSAAVEATALAIERATPPGTDILSSIREIDPLIGNYNVDRVDEIWQSVPTGQPREQDAFEHTGQIYVISDRKEGVRREVWLLSHSYVYPSFANGIWMQLRPTDRHLRGPVGDMLRKLDHALDVRRYIYVEYELSPSSATGSSTGADIHPTDGCTMTRARSQASAGLAGVGGLVLVASLLCRRSRSRSQTS